MLQGLDLSGNRLGGATSSSSAHPTLGGMADQARQVVYADDDHEGDEEGGGSGPPLDTRPGHIDIRSGSIVRSLGALRRLRCLDLTRSGLRNQAADLAVSLRYLSELERVGLGGNEFGPEGAAELSPAIGGLRRLQRLGMGSNLLGDEGAEAIAEAIAGLAASLERLDLRKNGITVRGAVALAPALMAPMRLHLDIEDSPVDSPAGLLLKSLLRVQKRRVQAEI